MRHHALPDPDFAALGAGRPSAATLAELRRAQLGKHLLLLREIVRAGPGRTPSWYAELTALQRTSPQAARAVLAEPLFGVWARQRLTALRSGDPAAAAHPPGPAAAPDPRFLTAEQDGLRIRVRLEDHHPLRDHLGLTTTGRLDDAAVAHWQACLAAAWRRLVTRHRAGAEIVAAVLDVIVPVEPDPAAHGISATSADAFGAMAMSVPADGTELAVGLLHETQHSVLNAVRYLFDLHTAPDAPGYSPWRDDPRPASGILHGAYAYLAVTRFWRTEAAADPDDRLAAFEFARWRTAVAGTADTLLARGGLTPAGTRFVTALRDEVRPWLADPVDPRVSRLAAVANADHGLRWRLRNRRVEPAAVRALAEAWRRAAPRPPSVPAAVLAPAPRRSLESSPRLDLIHRTLRGRATDPPAGAPATAGDTAFLGGDHGTALRAYREAVDRDPSDDAAWAGLALVAGDDGLTRHLEVVAALRRMLGRAGADPVALARWISP